MLKSVWLAFIVMVAMGFTSAGNEIRAQNKGQVAGDLDSYNVNSNGQIDSFWFKQDDGTTVTITVSSPSQAITDAIEAAHHKRVDVWWTSSNGGATKEYDHMVVH